MSEPSFPIYQFWSDVASTSIGVTIGGAFSLWLYALERKHQTNKDEREELARRQVILRHIMLSCASNIETAINFKSQIAMPLIADVERLEPIYVNDDIQKAIALSASLRHMFQVVQSQPFTPLPSNNEMVFITDEAPMLLGLSVRLSESFQALNQSIDLRNKYIEQFAAGASTGMEANMFKYYFAMLISTGKSISQLTDDAAFFTDILSEQTYNFGKSRFKGINLVNYKLDDDKHALIPPKDYLAGFRRQFKDFSNDEPNRTVRRWYHKLWPW